MLILCAIANTCNNSLGQTLNFQVVSNTNTKVSGTSGEFNAVQCNNPAWTAVIPEATWIWENCLGTLYTKAIFKVSFIIPGLPSHGNLHISFDDELLSVIINTKDTGYKFTSYSGNSVKNYDVIDYLVSGINTVLFTVKNNKGLGGLLFSLNITMFN